MLPGRIRRAKKLERCTVDGCDRMADMRGWGANPEGLCAAHWQRLARTGDVMADKPIQEKYRGINRNEDGSQKTCKTKGCCELAVVRGYCGMHWKRIKRYGTDYANVASWKLRTYLKRARAGGNRGAS